MAVAFDAASVGNSGATTVTSLTWSHVTGAGTNRLLLVGIAWTGSGSITSVTYGGAAMAAVGSSVQATTTYTTAVYYLLNPASGTNSIVVTPSGACSIYGGGSSYTGVAASAPTVLGTLATQSGFGAVGAAVTTTQAGVMLFDTIALANATSTLTVASGQTQDFNQFNTTAARTAGGSHTTAALASGASQTMGWTISGTTARSWAQIVVQIAPPATANTGQFFLFF